MTGSEGTGKGRAVRCCKESLVKDQAARAAPLEVDEEPGGSRRFAGSWGRTGRLARLRWKIRRRSSFTTLALTSEELQKKSPAPRCEVLGIKLTFRPDIRAGQAKEKG